MILTFKQSDGTIYSFPEISALYTIANTPPFFVIP